MIRNETTKVGYTTTGKLFHKVLPPSSGYLNDYWRTVCHFGWPIARFEDVILSEVSDKACSKCFNSWELKKEKNESTQ